MEIKELIECLKANVDQFISLANKNKERSLSYHEVLSSLFAILSDIQRLERHKLQRNEIVSYLEPVRELLSESPFFKRIQDWPRGYQGDFETIEYLISGINYSPKESIAYHVERYILTSPAVQQHRNKVMYQGDFIYKNSQEIINPRVLCLACGSSPDLAQKQEYLGSNSFFTLYDYDKDALDFSKGQLTRIKENCEYVEGNIFQINRHLKDHSSFDLIVIGGLFDYLKDKMIIKALQFIWSELVSNTGQIFFTNMSHTYQDRILIEYLADWVLITRDENDLLELCIAAGIEREAINIFRDQTNCTVMVEGNKSMQVTKQLAAS